MIEHKELPRAFTKVANEFVLLERLNDAFISAILVVKDNLGKVSVLVFDGEKFATLVNRDERLKHQNISTNPTQVLEHFKLTVKKEDSGGFVISFLGDTPGDVYYAFEAAVLMNLFMDEQSALKAAMDFLDNNRYF